jgi:multidrug efflux pump subunit AcrA (membrane-fusion protein)
MRRVWMVLGLIVVLSGAGCTTGQTGARQASETQTAQEQAAQAEAVVWASGKLAPERWAGLSPAIAGAVRAVHVREGDTVEAGKLLVELENGVLRSQVESAAAAVAEAEAARDSLLAGATVAQLATARADLAGAQAGVAQAQADLEQARESAAAAQSQVAIAQAQYDELASRPTRAELLQAQREINLAQLAVNNAQASYDLVKGNPDIAARPEALALQQATASLDAARAAYDVIAQGATRQQLEVAKAQVEAARTQAEVAAAAIPSAEARVRSAQAVADRAQAALDGLAAGATAEERAMADARVASASAALATAKAQLAQTRVFAPFSGQVGSVSARPGEMATPGQALLTLGDTSQMRVETTDLRETDVGRLRIGMPVEVTFDALPGRAFQGTIQRIAPMSSAEKGSTNYTVIVDVPALDPALRWGMTAFVNVQTAAEE